MTDREKLIELLNNVGSNILQFPTDGFIEHLAEYLLENGVTVQQWTSVDDYLPVEETKKYMGEFGEFPEYIVMIKGGELPTSLCFTGEKWIDQWYSDFEYEVTHWMPMPQPPKEVL